MRTGLNIIAMILIGVCTQPLSTQAREGNHEAPAQESRDPDDRFGYELARDAEYISYIEALDLSPEDKDRLWRYLSDKARAQADLDRQAEKELGESYPNEVDLLVITYDEGSEHARRREALRQEMEEELRSILTDEQRETHRRYREVKILERNARRLRHQIEDMELALSRVQFEVAMDVFRSKPAFFQQSLSQQGAAGYSLAYLQERERWRFDQEQDYLEAKLIPILNPGQVKRFHVWQEAERVNLNRRLEMFQTTKEFMARLYPENKRRIKMLSPEPLTEHVEKKPVYIECRDNTLFRIPVDEIRHQATEVLKSIAHETDGSTRSLMQELGSARVQTDAYRADLTYALLAQLTLKPRPHVSGYPLTDIRGERSTDWYGRILDNIDPEQQMVVFVVRDDSTEVYEKAKTLADARGLESEQELIDPIAPLKFALGGVPAIITDRLPAEHSTVPLEEEGKTATYIDVYRDHIVLYPEETIVSLQGIMDQEGPFQALLNQLSSDPDEHYVMLILRPRSANLANRIKGLVEDRGVSVGQKLYEAGQLLSLSNGR